MVRNIDVDQCHKFSGTIKYESMDMTHGIVINSADPWQIALGLWALFLMGLVGGASHCTLMCGGIVVGADTLQGDSSKWASRARFQLGRGLTYSLLAVALFAVGDTIGQLIGPDSRKLWRLVMAGLLFVQLIGFLLGSSRQLNTANKLGGHLRTLIMRTRPRGLSMAYTQLISGIAWGLIPCGLSWMAILAAMQLPSLPLVVAGVTSFWLGTVPAHIGIYASWTWIAGKVPTVVVGPMVLLYIGFLVFF